MATRLKPVDVVLVGVGWTGAILAKELGSAGLKVVGLERGRMRDTEPDFAIPQIHDELRYAIRYDLMQDLSKETITFRHKPGDVALPMRQHGSFLLGTDVGGAGVHWNGQTFRFPPTEFVLRSHYERRYGKKVIPGDMTIQDWGVTYEELEPHYDRFEYLCGTAGKAGNLKGQIQSGGNPFEGPRSREYPNPPMKRNYAMVMFEETTKSLDYHPYIQPSSNCTQPYTNPEGQNFGACDYCGFCERFACEFAAKASPQVAVLPAAFATKNFELRTLAHVTKVNLDKTRKHATGVTYVDASGRELEQPAEMVILCAYGLNNVRLMMLSGVGHIYDPRTGKGTLGRNYAYQMSSNVQVHFEDKIFNPFMSAGAQGMIIDDFNGDNFDHAGLGFIGGAYMIGPAASGQRPIEFTFLPEGTPRWGHDWKKAMAQYYNRTFIIGCFGGVMSYRDAYLDLDPTYRDIYGQPLQRMTFDFHTNELTMSKYVTDVAAKIARAMNPSKIKVNYRSGHYSIVPYQTTHNTGGAIMGTDPTRSAVNRYLQSWDVPNLFVMGASAFPQNPAHNPTTTVGALTYWAADAITTKYLKDPGKLI